MNKAELVEEIKSKWTEETTKEGVKRALEAVLDGIRTGLKKSGRVQIIGFGTFKVAHRSKRECFNPKTGKKLTVPASNTVRLNPGAALKALVNKKGK